MVNDLVDGCKTLLIRMERITGPILVTLLDCTGELKVLFHVNQLDQAGI